LAETAALNDRAGVSGLSGNFLPLELFSQLNYAMVIVNVELIAFIMSTLWDFCTKSLLAQKMLACEFEVWYKK
jgi:hypothetical protein